MPAKIISPANLSWDDQGQPRSIDFEDLYFSAENGLEETRYVFLKGNDLAERWRNLTENANFVICETGFGSGLNLLAAAQLWNACAPERAQMHFISTELYPMRVQDLKRALALWPELAELAEALISAYPALTPGFHRFQLTERISVTLIFKDVIDGLTSLCPTLAPEMWHYQNWQVNAWFLDGFSPSKNPELWTDRLFALVNRLSGTETSIATFTCAGVAKRGLKNWGFDIEKIPGYGRKREMLIGKKNLSVSAVASSTTQSSNNLYHYRAASPCWHLDQHQQKKAKHVAIIGAGIAGCTLAEALGRRGIHTTLFDADKVASGASGFPQAGLYARLSPDQGDLEDFCLHALNYARGFYLRQKTLADKLGSVNSRRTNSRGTNSHSTVNSINLCGLIQLPKSEHEREKMQLIANRFSDAPQLLSYQSAEQLSELSGQTLNSDGLWFPGCGWVDGPALCQSLVEQSRAELKQQTPVTGIIELENGVRLIGEDQINLGQFDAVVICTATQAPPVETADWLPIRPIRGQISFLQNQPEITGLKTVICKKTSVTPANQQGICSVGATYEIDQNNSHLKPQDHQTNLEQLQDLLAIEKPLDITSDQLTGRAATRATTPDYLPLVGSLPMAQSFQERFKLWSKDRKRPVPKPAENHSGIYLNLGYGSRGYTYAPLCAEILAAKITAEPEPVSMEMQRTLHPARFLVRSLAKNKPLKN